MCRKSFLVVVILLGVAVLAPLADADGAMPSEPVRERAPASVASASSIGDSAWMVLDSIDSDKVRKVNGNIRLSLLDFTHANTPQSRDRARVIATFQTAPDEAKYTVRFVKVLAEGEEYAVFGGVMTRHEVFGDSGVSYTSLPRVLAMMGAWGTAEIFKGDESLASDLDAIVLVVPGIRDLDTGKLLTADQIDLNRSEIHLILPGSLEKDGKTVPDTPGGFLYLIWPDAAIEMRNVGGRVIAPISAPTATAAGMYGGTTPGEQVVMMDTPPEDEVVEVEATIEEPAAKTEEKEPEVKVKGMVQQIGTRPLNVMLMEDEVVADPLSLAQGNVVFSVANIASRPAGLMIVANDITGRKFTRYTPVMNPGERIETRLFAGRGTLTLTSYRHVKGPRFQYLQLSGSTTLYVK